MRELRITYRTALTYSVGIRSEFFNLSNTLIMIDIEKLETLPTRMSRKDYLTAKYGDMWNLRFDDSWYRSDKSDYYWTKLQRILKAHIGKNVDEAYSKYCKVVEPYEKYYFFGEFKDRTYYTAPYTLDLNRCIQVNPDKWQNKKKPIIFRSFDYTCGYYDTLKKEYVPNPRNYWLYVENRYIYCVVQGFEKTFESKQDPEYKRLKAEKIKAQKLNKRLLKQEAKEKEYNFFTKNELIKRQNKRLKEQGLLELVVATRNDILSSSGG